MSVNESSARVGIQQIPGAPQRPWGKPVIRRHQNAVVTVGPLEQALVEGRDIPFVDCVDGHLHAMVASRDLPGHIGAVVRRGIVDDEHSHIDAFLVIQHAGDGFLKEVPVPVTRDDDTHRTHRMLSGSRRYATDRGVLAAVSVPTVDTLISSLRLPGKTTQPRQPGTARTHAGPAAPASGYVRRADDA